MIRHKGSQTILLQDVSDVVIKGLHLSNHVVINLAVSTSGIEIAQLLLIFCGRIRFFVFSYVLCVEWFPMWIDRLKLSPRTELCCELVQNPVGEGGKVQLTPVFFRYGFLKTKIFGTYFGLTLKHFIFIGRN